MKRIRHIFIALCLAASLAVPVGSSAALQTSTDPLQAADHVCVAVPVVTGKQGNCPAGQQEINNSASSGGAIVVYLRQILKLINGLVAGVVILVLIIAGVQYITSTGDPAKVKQAKGRIINALTALLLYLMMVAILNFLIPGGVL